MNAINQVNFGFGFEQLEQKSLACDWQPIWNQAAYSSKSSINQTWSQSWSFVIWKEETKYYWPPHKASKLCLPFILGWSFETCMIINQTKNQCWLYKASKLQLSLKLGRGRKEGYGWYTTNMHVLLFVPCSTTLCTCDKCTNPWSLIHIDLCGVECE